MEYREFTCIVCGEKGIDKSHKRNKMFCSKECGQAHYRQINGFGSRVGEDCYFNEGVACDEHHCENCGWNPAVIKIRKEAAYAQRSKNKQLHKGCCTV